MKAEAILNAIAKAEGRGMAAEALSNLPAGDMPTDILVELDTEAMGPPEVAPPIETGEAPAFDEATSLPFIAMENAPEELPADANSNGAAGKILGYLFG